jgi:hypothetical protein
MSCTAPHSRNVAARSIFFSSSRRRGRINGCTIKNEAAARNRGAAELIAAEDRNGGTTPVSAISNPRLAARDATATPKLVQRKTQLNLDIEEVFLKVATSYFDCACDRVELGAFISLNISWARTELWSLRFKGQVETRDTSASQTFLKLEVNFSLVPRFEATRVRHEITIPNGIRPTVP